MTLSIKGANYPHRDHIKDEYLRSIHDDHASKIQAILAQGNFGATGAPDPPSAPTALQVTAASGLFTATVTHNSAPAGTQYVLQYSSSPNFLNPISELLNHTPTITTNWARSFPNQKFYFRVAAKFPASNLSPWVYAGSMVSPTLVG